MYYRKIIMDITDNERMQLGYFRLKKMNGYDILPPETRNTLLHVFRLGMIEQEILDRQERLFEMKLEHDNLRTDG
jgi:hypothetical protein